jgi:hypothetical protein
MLYHLSQSSAGDQEIPEVRGSKPLTVNAFLKVLDCYSKKLRPSKPILKESARQLKQITKTVLGDARVVVTTCNSGDSIDLRQPYPADIVIFDEAA